MNPNTYVTVMAAMMLAIIVSMVSWNTRAAQAQDVPEVQQQVEPADPADGGHARRAFSDGVKQGKLEAALMFSEALSPYIIASEVNGDRAVLKGEVAKDIEKELAEVIAMGVDGIAQVDNQLVVDSAATRRDPETDRGLRGWVEDAGITAQLKAEFAANRDINLDAITISTKRGVVTLEGAVESKVVKDLAEQIVRTSERVNGVKNRLRVEES